ncbi:MAG TPA: hypothetical protein VMV74_08425 [Bacteroidales bacterium]|nr:hypothetical protein [Bacteroidales bacterium]
MSEPEMNKEQRISAFATLGSAMRDAASGTSGISSSRFINLIDTLEGSNPWFTPENVRKAVGAIGDKLTYDNLSEWLKRYPEIPDHMIASTVGVVMAGNIPLVGFHDMLCVLITGNRLNAKLSSKDDLLIRAVTEVLTEAEPALGSCISLTDGTLSGFDAVIATGSDNTSRYFEYYFRDYPSIIRRTRNSVAVLDGTENDEELRVLGEDVFAYFGLGCRSISKLYIPERYDINRLTSCWQTWEKLRKHHKYAVNYDHNKALMIVNRQHFTDTGYLLLRQESSLTPPMAVLNFEYYPSSKRLKSELETAENLIQCVTGHGSTPLGKAQQPELWDYADAVDTILFLLKKIPRGEHILKNIKLHRLKQ